MGGARRVQGRPKLRADYVERLEGPKSGCGVLGAERRRRGFGEMRRQRLENGGIGNGPTPSYDRRQWPGGIDGLVELFTATSVSEWRQTKSLLLNIIEEL